jgi:hypothetical protein
MAKLVWDQTGERLYETGVQKGVLQPSGGAAVAWNGLTGVTVSPSGAEATALYADDIKYLNLMSAEEVGATIEAYMYPDEFAECNGEKSPVKGVYIGQQTRKKFDFCWRTTVGNDEVGNDYGYKLHFLYNCLAGVSEKAYATVNDSPEAMTLSWEVTTTPIAVEGYKPTAYICVDSTAVDATKLAALEKIIYGDDTTGTPKIPSPAEVIAALSA